MIQEVGNVAANNIIPTSTEQAKQIIGNVAAKNIPQNLKNKIPFRPLKNSNISDTFSEISPFLQLSQKKGGKKHTWRTKHYNKMLNKRITRKKQRYNTTKRK